MPKRDWLARILAVAGTALVWLPLLFTLVISVTTWIQRRMFRFDYLLPAEVFPITVLGAGLLYLASRRARLSFRPVGWWLLAAVALWLGGQLWAVVTGLASGRTELTGGYVVGAGLWIGAFVLATVAMAIGALGLLRAILPAGKTVSGEGR